MAAGMDLYGFTVLIVDDEENMRSAIRRMLRVHFGKELMTLQAGNGKEALAVLERDPVHLAILDLRMPGMDGLTLLREMKNRHPDIPALILTGNANIQDAVVAMKLGAVDVLEKTAREDVLRERVEHFILLRNATVEKEGRIKGRVEPSGFENLIGESAPMRALKNRILKVAPTDSSVLIQGETGTGKELIARALHLHSRRRTAPFVPVDCATLNTSTAESELFGYVKGAFTGAEDSAVGLFRSADSGTLFFDEIGELPFLLQSKLLRVLQEREVRPLGTPRSVPVDIRILAATNRDLEREVRAGRFREDLFYRLNVIRIDAPPLRERLGDLPLLMAHLLTKRGAEGLPASFSAPARELLERYYWPGNVRELENVLLRASALHGGTSIEPEDLATLLSSRPGGLAASGDADPPANGKTEKLSGMEATAIQKALGEHGGNRKKASESLGIGEATLYRKIKKYGLKGTGGSDSTEEEQ